jgi:D-lyxose ketol-isomerase
MKRSEVEKHIAWAKKLIDEVGCTLPSFAYWTLDEWREKGALTEGMRKIMLGWDVTDYGMGDFRKIGNVLFTIRNGSLDDKTVGTPYAEKLIPILDGQRLPMHCHHSKTEDIVNRGGGVMFMKLYNSLPDGSPDFESDVTVLSDGLPITVKAGEEFYITRGNSLSLTPGMYHIFGAKADSGDLVVGEVSSINDDNTDNNFYEDVQRFVAIEEDVLLTVPLCNEYDAVL